MGSDRYKLMRELNLAELLPKERAQKYRALWNEFLNLYDFLNADKLYGPIQTKQFERRAKAWVELLTEPSVGKPKTANFVLGMCDKKSITPYIHCLVMHIREFLDLATSIKTPLRYFSSEPVEKKNHIHVQLFYSKTHMDGLFGKSSVEEILEIENRDLYFSHIHQPHQPNKMKKSYSP
jgi:hypothetical protein